MRLKDMTGLRQGHLTVIRRAENAPGSHRALWLCECDCGKTVTMRGDVLRSGSSSCGCVGNRKHGGCSGGKLSSLYVIWRDMRARCNYQNNVGYHLYGARGISVCREWDTDFAAFRDWSLSHGYQDGLTIDRIDPNGNYNPDNCRWATNAEQQVNKRNTVFVEVQGERKPLSHVARQHDISPQSLYKAWKRGANIDEWIKKRIALKNKENGGY